MSSSNQRRLFSINSEGEHSNTYLVMMQVSALLLAAIQHEFILKPAIIILMKEAVIVMNRGEQTTNDGVVAISIDHYPI